MISKIYLLSITFFIFSCQWDSQNISYPISKKNPEADNYFGVEVFDNYRWLEDDNAEKIELAKNNWMSTWYSKHEYRRK